MVWIFSSEQKLTGGISFTMQFPMATVKKNALYVSHLNMIIVFNLKNQKTGWTSITQKKNLASRRFIINYQINQ
jgi:hypothetical protein